jgi:hypothetical protein
LAESPWDTEDLRSESKGAARRSRSAIKETEGRRRSALDELISFLGAKPRRPKADEVPLRSLCIYEEDFTKSPWETEEEHRDDEGSPKLAVVFRRKI